jgi:hypothetical protein
VRGAANSRQSASNWRSKNLVKSNETTITFGGNWQVRSAEKQGTLGIGRVAHVCLLSVNVGQLRTPRIQVCFEHEIPALQPVRHAERVSPSSNQLPHLLTAADVGHLQGLIGDLGHQPNSAASIAATLNPFENSEDFRNEKSRKASNMANNADGVST